MWKELNLKSWKRNPRRGGRFEMNSFCVWCDGVATSRCLLAWWCGRESSVILVDFARWCCFRSEEGWFANLMSLLLLSCWFRILQVLKDLCCCVKWRSVCGGAEDLWLNGGQRCLGWISCVRCDCFHLTSRTMAEDLRLSGGSSVMMVISDFLFSSVSWNKIEKHSK